MVVSKEKERRKREKKEWEISIASQPAPALFAENERNDQAGLWSLGNTIEMKERSGSP
jgi:hypothetical protein